jgi:hypothetical protein
MEPSDANLVAIFKTEDPGVLPLATMALDAEGIDYAIRSVGKTDTLQWIMSQQPTIRPRVLEIVVAADVAAKARDLVVDLERPIGGGGQAPLEPTAIPNAMDPPTVTLENASTGISVGAITENQLQELSSRLEEEAPQQYFVNAATIEMLESAGADAALIALLRSANGDSGGLSIRWFVR